MLELLHRGLLRDVYCHLGLEQASLGLVTVEEVRRRNLYLERRGCPQGQLRVWQRDVGRRRPAEEVQVQEVGQEDQASTTVAVVEV